MNTENTLGHAHVQYSLVFCYVPKDVTHMLLDYFTDIGYESVEQLWALIHEADGRLTAGSREVSKPPDLNFPNRSEIWQASRQRCCRGACQISERYDHYISQSYSIKTSSDLAVRRLTAYSEVLDNTRKIN